MTVIGVPTSMQEKEVLSYLYKQNLGDVLSDKSLEMFLSSVKLSHKSGRKDAKSCNFIIQVIPTIRNALIPKGSVFINWSSSPIRDFTLVTRCYKCHQYSHVANTCRYSIYTCGHCGLQGQTINECIKLVREPQCATCLRLKKPSKHNTGVVDCPAKIIAE